MKTAILTMFVVAWAGSSIAAGIPADANPRYLNYDYPTENPGQSFSILRTGAITAAGIYEPGYVNYRYPQMKNAQDKPARTGKWLANGVFEPTYVNYCVERQ